MCGAGCRENSLDVLHLEPSSSPFCSGATGVLSDTAGGTSSFVDLTRHSGPVQSTSTLQGITGTEGPPIVGRRLRGGASQDPDVRKSPVEDSRSYTQVEKERPWVKPSRVRGPIWTTGFARVHSCNVLCPRRRPRTTLEVVWFSESGPGARTSGHVGILSTPHPHTPEDGNGDDGVRPVEVSQGKVPVAVEQETRRRRHVSASDTGPQSRTRA